MSTEQKSSVFAQHSADISRRSLLGYSMLAACVAALDPLAQVVLDRGWTKAAKADEPDPSILLPDTISGLVAFIVPGSDSYSIHQSVSTAEPGGIDANIVYVLMESLNKFQPAPPPFPSFSVMVATVLNNVAMAVNPSPSGPFSSPFANLSFQEKVGVFAGMEADPSLQTLAALLPTFVAFLSYSETGVFDPETQALTGQPVGWTTTGYEFAHGHDEFKGYYQDRRSVAKSDTMTGLRGGIDHA